MIELAGVTRVFVLGTERVEAVKGIDLKIEQGDYVALVGPSGSGKSTLMHILGLLDSPTSGSYRLAGEEVSGLPERQLARLRGRTFGFVFQVFHMLPQASATKNVELPLIYADVPGKERRERARAALAKVGLAHRFDHRPNELSGGERQRVAIARALVNDPSVILADEPTGNLDQKTGQGIIALFEELKDRLGITLVIVTHDPAVSARAWRQVGLLDGRIESDVARAGAKSAP